MDRMSRSAWCALGLLLLTLAVVSAKDATAAALRHSKNFVLPSAETIHDDLYVAGTTVDIQGIVDGDLIVCGQTVTIGGTVTGDVIAAGRDVTIAGSVGGTLRAAGNAVTVDGAIAHDALVACGTLVIGPRATIGRDVLAGAGNSSLGGRIERDVRVGSTSASFSGSVGGVVYAHAKDLRLSDGAVLEHELFYTSPNELTKSSGAVVNGRVERHAPAPESEHRGRFAGRIIGWLQGLVGFAILGALFYLLFKNASPRAVEALGRAPWASLGLGLLLAFGFPCAAAFLFILGLIFGGWWIALGGIALYFFALALGYVVSATYVGRWLLRRAGQGGAAFGWTLLAGLAALGLVTAIPFLGNLLALAAIFFGLGALAMAWYQARRSVASPAT